MAGFKESCLQLNPVCFLTFDGDNFDPVTFDLIASPKIILDESGRSNHALFETDNNGGHRMGLTSLVDLEPADQYCISLGYYGAPPGIPNNTPSTWPKTFLEVPNSADFNFNSGTNFGSFSVSFMYRKATDEGPYRTFFSPTRTANLTRPIFSKGTMVRLDYVDRFSNPDRLELLLPNGTQLNFDITNAQFYGDTKHIVFTWRVVQIQENIYEGTGTLYINGQNVISQTFQFIESYPNTSVNDPWLIGGSKATMGSDFNDRNTLDTRYDQFAIFPFALSHNQVCWLFKKTRLYENLVAATFPSFYWLMDDPEDVGSTEMKSFIGNRNGSYRGGVSKITRQRPGPGQIPNSRSVFFQNGGLASVNNTSFSLFTPFFNPTGDYTIEFWFNVSSTTRGVLLSIQNEQLPFNGMLVQINQRSNTYFQGGVQFNITEDLFVNSLQTKADGTPYDFADERWHHCAVIRRDAKSMELWLDGIQHAVLNTGTVQLSSAGPGQLYVMGMMPGSLWVTGNMAHLALIPRALQEAEIKSHWAYSTIYKVSGITTIQGAPNRADIRVYDHMTGELIDSTESDSTTGEYSISLLDNRFIDILVLNKSNRNVRYRAFGPIIPSTFNDLPES